MKQELFANTRPGLIKQYAGKTIELPVLYQRVDFVHATFTADLAKVRALMPSEHVHPVQTWNGRALLTIGSFDVLASSAGPFGVGTINVAVVHGTKPPAMLPALGFEARWPGFGHLSLYVATTTKLQVEALHGEGFPAFSAGLTFENGPELMRSEVTEGTNLIYSLGTRKSGLVLPMPARMNVYGGRGAALTRSTWRQSGFTRVTYGGGAIDFELGSVHPVARAVADLDLDPRALMSRYSLDVHAVVPASETIETGTRPVPAYGGADQEGSLRQHVLA